MAEEQQQEDQAPKSESPGMDKALSGGWRPEDEWEGNPEDWVDYREFNVRGELMGRIQEQSGVLNSYKKQLDEQRQALKDMAKLQDTIAEREYNKLMKQLKNAKAEAIESSDGEAVTEIDEQIDNLKSQREGARKELDEETQEAERQLDNGVPPEIQDWIADSRNSWYSTDSFLQTVAHGLAAKISEKNPDWTPLQVVHQMEKDIRKELPHKFERTSPVDDGGGDGRARSNSGGRARTRKFTDLSQEEQAVAKRLEKTGTMTIEEYIAKLDGE